ncbi:MAG: TIGR03773 family transporter-associated surface protein [Actinomycetaceae bacterium]|nr:TIGR03773 family transporter-associated surface protein [Arcanobacterium sp.]MDD7504758.1 TIGR03773 family transporter-associated surface protein [Actinomycetaceae bacterium]
MHSWLLAEHLHSWSNKAVLLKLHSALPLKVKSTLAVILSIALALTMMWGLPSSALLGVGDTSEERVVLPVGHIDSPKVYWENDGFTLKANAGRLYDLEQTVSWLRPNVYNGGEQFFGFTASEDSPALDFLGQGTTWWAAPANCIACGQIWQGYGADTAIPYEKFRDAAGLSAPEADGTFWLNLVSLDGPGRLEMLRGEKFDDEAWGTYQRILSSEGTGMRTAALKPGTHTHIWTLFSAPGDYTLVWQVTGRKADGTIVTSQPTKQYWRVGGSEPEARPSADLADRFAAAVESDTSGYSFSVRPAHNDEADEHGLPMASWTFSAPDNVSGTAEVYVNGYLMTTIRVRAGEGEATQMPAAHGADYQVVFFPDGDGKVEGRSDGNDESTDNRSVQAGRWVSETIHYAHGDSEQTTTASGSLPVASVRPESLDLSDVVVPRDASATVTLSPGRFDTTFSAQVQVSDPRVRGDIILDFFSPGSSSPYPEFSYTGALVDGVWSDQIEAYDDASGLEPRVTILPHSSMVNVHRQTITVTDDFDPDATTEVTVALNTEPVDQSGSSDPAETIDPDENAGSATHVDPANPADPTDPVGVEGSAAEDGLLSDGESVTGSESALEDDAEPVGAEGAGETDAPASEEGNAQGVDFLGGDSHDDGAQPLHAGGDNEEAAGGSSGQGSSSQGSSSQSEPTLASGKRYLLDAGHVDLAAELVDGELDLRVKDDTGAVSKTTTRHLPHEVAFGVRDHAREINTDKRIAQGFGFFGDAGSPVYVLPEAEKRGLIWPGYSTEFLTGSVDPESLALNVAVLDGPGDVKLYQTHLGRPTVLFDSAESDESAIQVPGFVHVHTGWAFTEPGRYEVIVYYTARNPQGEVLPSVERSVTFLVGDAAIASASDVLTADALSSGVGSASSQGSPSSSDSQGPGASDPEASAQPDGSSQPDGGSQASDGSQSEPVPAEPISETPAVSGSDNAGSAEAAEGAQVTDGRHHLEDAATHPEASIVSVPDGPAAADADGTPGATSSSSTGNAQPHGNLVLDHGHADIFNVSLTGGKLHLNLKEDVTGAHVPHDPENVTLVVKRKALMKLPAGYPGEPRAYVLPLNQDQKLLWPGWNTLETQAQKLGTVDIEVTKVHGPGEVHLFSQDFVGNPQPLLREGTKLPGIITVPEPAHVHAYWVFTKPGTYTMEVKARAVKGGAKLESDTRVYTWVVEDGNSGAQASDDDGASTTLGVNAGAVTSGASQDDGLGAGSPGSHTGSDALHTASVTPSLGSNVTASSHQTNTAAQPSQTNTTPQPNQTGGAPLALTRGHVDAFFLNPARGGLELLVREDVTGSGVLHRPEDVRFLVGDGAKITVPAGLPHGGKPGWVLPMIQNPQLLWPGWSTERITGSADFSVSVSGPGQVFVFTTGLGGKPMSVLRGGGFALPGTIHVPAPSHVHANWVFTQPGIYTFSVRGSAQGQTTRTATYTFAVGNKAATQASLGAKVAGGTLAGSGGMSGAGATIASLFGGRGDNDTAVTTDPTGAVALNSEPVMSGVCAVAGESEGLPASLAREGHFDLGPQLIDGKLVAMIRDDRVQPAHWLNSGDLAFGLGEEARAPAPEELGFLTEPGSNVWMISSVQQPGVPWLGETSQHESIVTGTAGEVRTTITGIQGPGQVAHFLPTALGSGIGTMLFSTVDGPSSYVIPANTHMHGTWVFTAPGEYVISYQHQVSDKSANTLTSDGHLTVVVGACDPASLAPAAADTQASKAGLAASHFGDVDGRGFDVAWWIQTALLCAVLVTNVVVLVRWAQRRRTGGEALAGGAVA